MNLWDKILQASGLPECSSIKDHLCSSINNSGSIDNIVNGIYNVTYKGQEYNVVKYIDSVVSSIKYLEQKSLPIIYLGQESNVIKYIPSDVIKIEYICK